MDLSTRVAISASKILQRVRERVSLQIPLGPMKRRVSNKEYLDRVNSMSPEQRKALAQQMGTDAFLDMVNELEEKQ